MYILVYDKCGVHVSMVTDELYSIGIIESLTSIIREIYVITSHITMTSGPHIYNRMDDEYTSAHTQYDRLLIL